MSEDSHRSLCPINLSLEVFGDKWSLIVIRDMMFGNRRHFRELLTQSLEGIASNILANRLSKLVEVGILTRRDDPSHKQKAIYSLTEKGIQLLPIFAQLGAWGRRYTPANEELSIRAELLEKGGPDLWEDFMDELREIHLGTPRPALSRTGHKSVFAMLQAAFEQTRDARRQAQAAAGGAEQAVQV